jgi:hypothetical protein
LSTREVIEQADVALFEAKSAGRNRVRVAASLEGQLESAAAAVS